MTITLEAIRAAGGIVHSDGNIFFRDISMLQGLAGAVPAAVAGPAWDKTRDSLATLLLGLAGHPFLNFDVACIALDVATERGMPLAYMRAAPAAPALEAPAAPPVPVDEFRGDTPSLVRNIVALLELDADGALVPHGVGGHARGLLSAAAARLAAAPQAPAGLDELRKISEIAACWGCEHPDEPGDTEVVRRVKWAARQLRAVSQAPAAPSTHAGMLAAAAHIQAKAQAHLDERGSYDPDTGAVEMSESNQEHFNTLDELAEEIRMMAEKAAPASCDKTPAGWTCSRAQGHDGPCAAAPAAPAVDARDTARMDWLEAQVVNVRAPLRYGSRDLFWASPEEVDGGPDGPSDLRARIDAAQAAAKGSGDA